VNTFELDHVSFGNRKIINVEKPWEALVSFPDFKQDVVKVHKNAEFFLEGKAVGIFLEKVLEGQFF
jgi:hypothetical protein